MGEDMSRAKVVEKVVSYVGLSDRRVIYKSDQESYLGIDKPEKDIVWHKGNQWTIPANDLPEQILEYCQHDHEFVIRGA